MDKQRKKELLRQYKEKELAEARRKMYLSPEQLSALLDYLAEKIKVESHGPNDFRVYGCDHTRRHTRAWAEENNLDVDRVEASLDEFGGFCDCEVLFNVTPGVFGW